MVRLIKQIAPIVANSIAFEKFVGLLEHTDVERKNLFRVLTYHRVDEPKAHLWLDPGLISASPEAFEAQMKYLAANYEVVSVLEVVKAFENQGRKLLPPRAVVITFDDAYRDFEKFAWPILKQHRIPVTLFVSTAYPDHPERLFWWDRVYNAIHTTVKGELNTSIGRLSISTIVQRKQAYKRLKDHFKMLPNDVAMLEVDQLCSGLGASPQPNCVLGWDSLRKLASEGVTLGAHTRTHPIMNNLAVDDIQTETTGSIHDLQREIGLVPQVFAYPSGIHNQDAVKAVEHAGFALAFTTERGINDVGHADRLRLRRINVGARTTIPILRAQLLSRTAKIFSWSENIF
jgi:peptidoglycan/xylan/chitin deacetylase (PgdA/CDA1 family)